MIKEKAFFNNGVYEKKCSLFNDISIGSVLCVGHSEIKKIKKCVHYHNHLEQDTFYLPILNETINIVSEVHCKRPVSNQLKLF